MPHFHYNPKALLENTFILIGMILFFCGILSCASREFVYGGPMVLIGMVMAVIAYRKAAEKPDK